jgi:hypothetical protein
VLEPLQQALDALFKFLKDLINGIFKLIIDPLLKPIIDAFNRWANEVAALIMSFLTSSMTAFVRGLVNLVFFSAFALAILAIIVAISVAEKITNAVTLGLANLAGFVIGGLAGLIIGLLFVSAIGEWVGSNIIQDIIPPEFEEAVGTAFGIAQFLVAYHLARRPLKPIQGVETALKDSLMALMLIAVHGFIERAPGGNSVTGLIFLIMLDVVALYDALSGLKDMITITGRGWNLVRMWYPFLYPVTLAVNAISIATTATDVISDGGKLKQALGKGG